MEEIIWIASRNYQAKPRDLPNEPWKDILVAISMPFALPNKERHIGTVKVPTYMEYCCTVQYGIKTRQSQVVGKDPLDAIFHGILAIENYLITMSKTNDLQNISGNKFNLDVDGFLSGVIAREYYKKIGSS